MTKLDLKKGDRVTYVAYKKKERGIVKSFSDETHVFVVYHCGEDWDRYFDYTAARTNINDLILGWPEEEPITGNTEEVTSDESLL